MKLLLVENLSRRLVPLLQADYPGSNQVVLLGMESASDAEVWQKAKDAARSWFCVIACSRPATPNAVARHAPRSDDTDRSNMVLMLLIALAMLVTVVVRGSRSRA